MKMTSACSFIFIRMVSHRHKGTLKWPILLPSSTPISHILKPLLRLVIAEIPEKCFKFHGKLLSFKCAAKGCKEYSFDLIEREDFKVLKINRPARPCFQVVNEAR